MKSTLSAQNYNNYPQNYVTVVDFLADKHASRFYGEIPAKLSENSLSRLACAICGGGIIETKDVRGLGRKATQRALTIRTSWYEDEFSYSCSYILNSWSSAGVRPGKTHEHVCPDGRRRKHHERPVFTVGHPGWALYEIKETRSSDEPRGPVEQLYSELCTHRERPREGRISSRFTLVLIGPSTPAK